MRRLAVLVAVVGLGCASLLEEATRTEAERELALEEMQIAFGRLCLAHEDADWRPTRIIGGGVVDRFGGLTAGCRTDDWQWQCSTYQRSSGTWGGFHCWCARDKYAGEPGHPVDASYQEPDADYRIGSEVTEPTCPEWAAVR